MDLSMFAGHDIELYFTYWTDPYTLELGWYIDDIEIPEIGFIDDVESGEGDWTVDAGWSITDGVVINDFEVNFIEMTNYVSWGTKYKVSSMNLDETTEEGSISVMVMDNSVVQRHAVMVAANQPGYEHTFGTFFLFTADKGWSWFF